MAVFPPARRRSALFVVKISKYCNLRCSYCYEYAHLGDRHRMSPGTLQKMFRNIVNEADERNCKLVSFVWHGGEPFLVPLQFYEEIGRLQTEIFTGRIAEWKNEVQTNLTVMTPSHLCFLTSKAFFSDGIGVSFDVYGDQRVDRRGRLRTDVVLGNLQKVLDHGIGVGAIAVLARNTLPHVREIYRFYDRIGVSCRFLPYYLSASDQQVKDHAITYAELVGALTAIFDAWFHSERATPVDPIDEYLGYAIAWLAGERSRFYDRESDEYVFVVDTDGGVWGQGEAYVPEDRYGDLTRDEFGAILSSPGRARAVAKSRARVKTYCGACRYFGACPGFYVGDATAQQQQLLASDGCPMRAVMDHIVAALERAKLTDLVSRRGKPQAAALSINL